jgi:hypothetical protein
VVDELLGGDGLVLQVVEGPRVHVARHAIDALVGADAGTAALAAPIAMRAAARMAAGWVSSRLLNFIACFNLRQGGRSAPMVVKERKSGMRVR